MALKLATTYKGIQLNDCYYKITSYSVTACGVNEDGFKTYGVAVNVNVYSDDNKIDVLFNENLMFNLLETDMSLSKAYGLLKTLEKFTNSIDV